jgi:adenosylcobinamide-phosphate synthase
MTLLTAFDSLLTLLPEYSITLTILFALLIDSFFGEAKKYHYLVGFGTCAHWLESRLNRQTRGGCPQEFQEGIRQELKQELKQEPLQTQSPTFSVRRASLGALSWIILVVPIPFIYWLCLNDLVWYGQVLLDGFIVYLAIGLTSLGQHAMQVYRPLKVNNLTKAQHFTGYLVSRDTTHLTPEEMARATTESMLENGHDSVIASLIYYLIGGAPLVIIHRLANTLDAMWGYKNSRFYSFGYASARLDDILGFVTGKCCTLLYAVQGRFFTAMRNAYQQGSKYKSHNGGWVMSAGATVMNKRLGGVAQYHGKTVNSVTLGGGGKVDIDDIPKSVSVVKRATVILFLLIFIGQTYPYFTFSTFSTLFSR